MKITCLFAAKAIRVLSVCFLSLLIGGATIVGAQDAAQVGVYFTTIVPRGGFSENVTNNGYGASGQFLVRLAGSPILAGGDLGIAVYGSVSHRRPSRPTFPNLKARVRPGTTISFSLFLLRPKRRTAVFGPYFDGLIGLRHLFTRTSISDLTGGETIASSTDLSDTALSYGFGGGLQIPLTKGREAKILLDTGVRYLRGARAEYLKKGSIRDVNGQVIFDVLSSRTDVLAVQVGVTFRF